MAPFDLNHVVTQDLARQAAVVVLLSARGTGAERAPAHRAFLAGERYRRAGERTGRAPARPDRAVLPEPGMVCLCDRPLLCAVKMEAHSISTSPGRRRRSSRLRVIAVSVIVGVLTVIGMRYLLLPRAATVSEAEHLLAGPPTFGFAGESGQPVARCVGPAVFGFFATTDRCTLTFPTGDTYRCTVSTTRSGAAGWQATCARHPERRSR